MVSIQRFIGKAAFFAGLFSFVCQSATAQVNTAAPLPTDPKVLKGMFANGLTYYVRPNAKPEKKVELRLIVNAGSILEDEDQQGLAHFMEHMNFNGTKNFEKNELVSYLQSIGVEFGADLNAYTSFDETVYILPVPTDKAGNLEKGFQIIEDWAHNALLTDKDIDEERAVVLEESRLGKGAEQRMLDKYLPELMSGSLYAKRLPIGKDDILKGFKYDKIRSFYKDWYRPELMAVAVSGDIDTATAMKLLRKHFAILVNKGGKKRFQPEVPARIAPGAMVLTDKEATNYQLAIIFPSVKAPAEKTVNDYRSNIVRQLAIQMINRRLSDLSRSSNPPFLGAGVGYDGWARGYENFSAFAAFGAEGPEKALNAVTAELLRVKQFGFNQSELEMAKKNVLAGMDKAYNERNTTESGSYVDEYARNFLQQEPIPGIENEYTYYKELVPGMTLDEMNKEAKAWMQNSNNAFSLITGPETNGMKLPDNAGLAAMVAKGFAQQVTALEEKQLASSLMDKKPTAGKVVSKVAEQGLDATTYTLSNGVKVTIKKTDFKSDEILLTGTRKGGKSNYGLEDKSNATYATAVVGAMGLGEFSPTDMEKILSGKTVKASTSISDIETNVSGSSNIKDIESMFQLLHLRMMNPRKDEGLFNAYRDKQKTATQFTMSNPQVSFFDSALKSLYGNNPLAPSAAAKPADFDAINLDRALEIYRNAFSNADGFHFFIVGNVDENTVLPLIETYIGSLPVTGKKNEIKDNGVRPVKGEKMVKIYKGSEPQSFIFGMYTGETKYSEDLQLKVAALAEVLNIKVIEEMREKLGGIYTGGYFGRMADQPYERYTLGIQLPCGPENVDKLLVAAHQEIENLKSKGPDVKDLDKVKTQWHEQHREEVKQNNYWLAELKDVLYWNRSKENALNYDAWIDKLKPSDIQQTAKLLFGKNEFTAILYPETQKK